MESNEQRRFGCRARNRRTKAPVRLLCQLLVVVFSIILSGCSARLFPPRIRVGPVQGVLNHSDGACRNPGLVTLQHGVLLASYECDGTAIYTQESRDHGVTWSAPIIAYAPPENYLVNNMTNLTLLSDGRVLLEFDKRSGDVNDLTYLPGVVAPDDRIDWGEPVTVSYDRNEWPSSCWSGGPIVQFSSRILVWPVYCDSTPHSSTDYAYLTSTVLRSTDGGMTWQQIKVADGPADGRNYDESAIAVLPNRHVVMMLRQTKDLSFDLYGTYWRAESQDGGASWSTPEEVINVEDVSRPTLAVLPSGGLIFMGRAALGGIEAATGFGVSWDEGRTFTPLKDLGVHGPGKGWDQYDAMSMLPDGSAAVVTTHGTGVVNIDYRNLVQSTP